MKTTQASSGNALGSKRDMIYISQFNQLALRDAAVSEVKIFDTTLRDGEQTPGIALSLRDKVRIAEALDEMGVHVIEAGFPTISEGEQQAVRSIAELKLDSRICGLARSTRKDIDAAMSCGVDYIHTFIATSDIHLKYKLKMSREEVKSRAIEAIEYARSHGLTVEFSCEDATRTDLDFLKEMHIAAQDAGAQTINVPDTVGVISPAAMEYLVSELVKVTKVPISVHCHNDFGLAVANSLAAVRAGARQVHVCVNGLGERSGNAALEEVAMGLFAYHGIEAVDLSQIGQVCRTVSRLTGYPLPNNKPIVGKNAFAHESGIHVHGVLGNASTYEAFVPELVGMHRQIVLGKHSGAHSVRDKLDQLKIDVPESLLPVLVNRVKELAETGKEVDDAELMALADHIMARGDRQDIVKLKEFAVFTGKGITPTATVTVEMEDGSSNTRSMTGIGPVDAAINAIRGAVNESIILDEYRLSAITGGSDSLCEVTVVIKDSSNGGKASVGKGIGSDIVQTSVEATMNAINRNYHRIKEDRN
ncbi:MAG: 2-isopropylmalate synthase [Candidatus Methanomethylophilaceae archaeon]|nr:2-isopropylmalate synthase [Candidatus Methanomethylophilaceae archaeon]